jgi:hypothetical protein
LNRRQLGWFAVLYIASLAVFAALTFAIRLIGR